MKKVHLIFIVISLIFTSFVYSQTLTLVNFKGGIDLAGTYREYFDDESLIKMDVDNGFSIALEMLMLTENSNFSFGFGCEYQIPRSLQIINYDINFIPFYFLLNMNLQSSKTHNSFVPFISGKIGYNLFLPDDDYLDVEDVSGGIYYGGGFGIMLNEVFFIEGVYSVNNGKYDFLLENINIKYSKFTIYFGIKS